MGFIDFLGLRDLLSTYHFMNDLNSKLIYKTTSKSNNQNNKKHQLPTKKGDYI